MLKNMLAGIWRRLPSGTRLFALRLVNPRFTVTAAAVIFNEKDQVLLLKHRFRPGSGWGLPGGFLKRGEQPLDALHRELSEEVGLEISQVEIFRARTFARPRQIEILFCGTSSDQPQPRSIEIECAVWFNPNELPAGLPKNQESLINRAVEKRRL